MKKPILFLLLIFFITSCSRHYGCIDPLATNYDMGATHDDHSCDYESAVINLEN